MKRVIQRRGEKQKRDRREKYKEKWQQRGMEGRGGEKITCKERKRRGKGH